MKRILSIFIACVICVSCVAVMSACSGGYDGEINVYNWGDYIADGSEDYLDTIATFEEEYNIKVNYTTYETNEELYNILSTSNADYDVIFPSDYMVEKLISEGLIQKLDYSKIPNSENLMDKFKKTTYDPDAEYSVAYSWNVTGLVYNKEMVKGKKPDSWEYLWDKDLSGSILQFNNNRDAYAIAMQLCGITPDTFDKKDVDKATEKLKEQKPLLKKYVMDQVFLEMEKDQAAISPYYAGDIYTMTTNNENLVGVLPKEGSNLFVDAMCIPKNAANVEGAHKFIDFMTRADISAANSSYITYASPVEGAKELLDKDLRESELVYPPDEYLEKCYTFHNVGEEIYAYMQEQFVKLMS
ncbi:MAG: spermidine/putrescine ABC transporter substrate-binding protein [Ruminococcus sp.]|nr:spermidine/putrescine ABC transporter substrate-binding protein [Ruminococcus sp.]